MVVLAELALALRDTSETACPPALSAELDLDTGGVK
jgi:hypothetical protein